MKQKKAEDQEENSRTHVPEPQEAHCPEIWNMVHRIWNLTQEKAEDHVEEVIHHLLKKKADSWQQHHPW